MNNIMVSFTNKKRARNLTLREEVIIIDEKLEQFGDLYISFFFFLENSTCILLIHVKIDFEFLSCQEYPDISETYTEKIDW